MVIKSCILHVTSLKQTRSHIIKHPLRLYKLISLLDYHVLSSVICLPTCQKLDPSNGEWVVSLYGSWSNVSPLEGKLTQTQPLKLGYAFHVYLIFPERDVPDVTCDILIPSCYTIPYQLQYLVLMWILYNLCYKRKIHQ